MYNFFKWAVPGLFFFIFVFSIQLTVNKCSIKFPDDWIRTSDFWYQKQTLYQLTQNHYPIDKQFEFLVGHVSIR